MIIRKFNFDNNKWDKFCYKSDDCWFYHTSEFIEYVIEYSGKNTENFSFYIEDKNTDLLAICPLIRNDNKFIFPGHTGPAPALRNALSEKIKKSILRQIFNYIEQLAKEYNIEECIMGLSPLAKNNSSPFNYNFLMKYGFENISLNTQILLLDKNKDLIWNEIKKSHRNEIKSGKKLFKFIKDEPYSKDTKYFFEFKKLHFLAAGRMTRSEKTWDLQRQWKEKGNAIIILAYMDDKPVGGIFTMLYKDCAYYGVSANHPDYEKYSISHSIQWEIIKWLQKNRFKCYELGLQLFSDQPYSHPSQKEIDISLFKRHFGGYTVSYYMGKKVFLKK